MILGRSPDDVRVIFKMGSGCYGLNGADTVSYDAALLSRAVGRPVRVQLSREDEMTWENYGYAYVIDQRLRLDAEGRIVAWDHEAWFLVLGSRPRAGRRETSSPVFSRAFSRRPSRSRRQHPSLGRTATAATRHLPMSPGAWMAAAAAPGRFGASAC